MPSTILTQNRLKELLHYDPLTGIFTWKIDKGSAKAGSRAGTKSHNYRQIKVDGVIILEHRLAFLYMLNYMPEQVDHDNHITADNRWINLYPSDYKRNGRNHKRTKRNTSGFVGVSWDKLNNKWLVRVRINGKDTNLGRYADFDEAVAVRKTANIKHNFHKNHGT